MNTKRFLCEPTVTNSNDVVFSLYSEEELEKMLPEKRRSLLEIAHELVNSKRAREYGSFRENMEVAGQIFTLLRKPEFHFTPEDGAYFLLALKLARESCRHKRDNLVDAAGYLELIDELLERNWETNADRGNSGNVSSAE